MDPFQVLDWLHSEVNQFMRLKTSRETIMQKLSQLSTALTEKISHNSLSSTEKFETDHSTKTTPLDEGSAWKSEPNHTEFAVPTTKRVRKI